MWCCILVNFILLLIFYALLLVANCGCWLIIFVVKSFDSMVENSYYFCSDSENIVIPRPPNLEGRDINLLSSQNSLSPQILLLWILFSWDYLIIWVRFWYSVLSSWSISLYVWIFWWNGFGIITVFLFLSGIILKL